MAEIPERIYEQTDAVKTDAWEIAVDNSSYAKTKKLGKRDLISNALVTGQATVDENTAPSLYSFANTNATETQFGTIKTATDTIAEGLSDTERALVAANIPPIFDAVSNGVAAYGIGNVYSTTDCNVDSISYWDQMIVGNYVRGECQMTIEVTAVESDVSILMNSLVLPKNIAVSAAGIYPEPTLDDKFFPMGIKITTFAGKLRFDLAKNANKWDTGTYTIAFTYDYFI